MSYFPGSWQSSLQALINTTLLCIRGTRNLMLDIEFAT